MLSIRQLCIPHGIWITWWEKSILPVRGAVNFLSFLFKFVIHKDIEKIIDLILLYNWFQVISSPALVDIVCDYDRFRSDPEFDLLMNYHQTPPNTFNQWVSAAPPNIPVPTIIVSPDVLDDDEATTSSVFLTDVDLLPFLQRHSVEIVFKLKPKKNSWPFLVMCYFREFFFGILVY